MPLRRSLLVLSMAFAVLIVSFAVLMAFQAFFTAVGDVTAARVLWGFSIASLVILVVVMLLLVGVLAFRALQAPGHGAEPADDLSGEEGSPEREIME